MGAAEAEATWTIIMAVAKNKASKLLYLNTTHLREKRDFHYILSEAEHKSYGSATLQRGHQGSHFGIDQLDFSCNIIQYINFRQDAGGFSLLRDDQCIAIR